MRPFIALPIEDCLDEILGHCRPIEGTSDGKENVLDHVDLCRGSIDRHMAELMPFRQVEESALDSRRLIVATNYKLDRGTADCDEAAQVFSFYEVEPFVTDDSHFSPPLRISGRHKCALPLAHRIRPGAL